MRHVCRILILLPLLFGPVYLRAQSNASDELRLGVADYTRAQYETAAEHFQKALSLEPHNLQAHLYLATTYAQQYIPGVNDPRNVGIGNAAVREYEKILEVDPNNSNGIKGIAYLNLQMKNLEKAKEYYRKAIGVNENDPEPYYSIAVIDWTQSYQPRMVARAKLSLKPDQPFIYEPVCWELRSHIEDFVKDGIDMLVEALKRRPDYDDAMAYMNLLYRERADIQCGDREAYKADTESADKWVDLTMAAKKGKSQDKQLPDTDKNSNETQPPNQP